MPTSSKTLIDLETRFWQSMVDDDPDTAISLLEEPALMVSSHGAMKFDHEAYRKMATQGAKVLTDFELSDVDVVFPNDATAVVTYRVKQSVADRGKTGKTTQDMADTSTWVLSADGEWRCVIHPETAIDKTGGAKH